MKTLFINLFLLFFLNIGLQAAGDIPSKSFLWEIKESNASVYLLGSIHAARQNLFPLKPTIEQAYENSDLIAVEVDLEKAAGELSLLVAAYGFFREGSTLQEHISSENHALLLEHLEKQQLAIPSFETMKPWYLSIILTNFSLKHIGAQTFYGVDHYLMGRAHRDNKTLLELEGATLQIMMLSNLPMHEQELLMVSSIAEDEQMEEAFEAMMQIWNQGNIPAMEKFIADSLAPYPELKTFNERFLYERNKKMAEKIDALIKKGGKVLVVVGVAHFLGEKGIIRLLEQKGYNPRQR